MGAMSDQALRAQNRHLMEGYTERIMAFKEASLATGAQVKTITLGEGTTTIVKEVIISVGANGNEWGADGYVEVHRTDDTPDSSEPSTTLHGKTYLANSNVLLFEENRPSTAALKLKIDHNAGSNKDVYIMVRYYYK